VNRDDTLRLDSQLCFLLYATTRAVTQAYAPLLEPLGLTYPQYLTMLALWEEDGATVGRLGQRLHLDSGTLTPLIKRLEAQALVERRRSAEDERVVQVHLTAAGRRLRGKAEGIPAAMFCSTGLSLNAAERLGTELRRILAALTAPAAPDSPPAPPTRTETKKESL
jgi:MarR family transcriptional regulator, organic hydroperoxide resistance regulator